MKILLDTCTFLWIITDAKELSVNARNLFSDTENQIYLSCISVWEILIKHKLGKLPLPDDPGKFITTERELHQIETLALEENAILKLSQLPNHHNDPFDRMLVCQAITHGLTVLTPDHHINQYPVPTSW